MMVKAGHRSNVEDVEAEDDVPDSHMQVTQLLRFRLSKMSWSPNMARSIKTDSAIAADNEGCNDTLSMMQGMSDTVWKVGCYRINPSTPSGQKFFILHMLVLPLIP